MTANSIPIPIDTVDQFYELIHNIICIVEIWSLIDANSEIDRHEALISFLFELIGANARDAEVLCHGV